MRLGVVSDTHVPSCCRCLPESLWRALEGCDHIIHAGDFDSWSTYEAFKRRFPVTAVVGNRDDFAACDEVPQSRILEIGGFRIGITHGWGARAGLPERVRSDWKEPVDLLVFGHSHEPKIHMIDGLKMLNPGSPTDVMSADRQTYALIDLNSELEISIHDLQP